MKVNEYKKLEDSIVNQDFNKSYSNINIIMFIFSIFGHLASIFLAFFMMSKILSATIENYTVVFISSIIILTAIELLKRDIFNKFSFEYLKLRTFGKEVLPLFLLSCLIISISFYSSVSGAKEFSSKSTKLDTDKKEILLKYKDSVTTAFNLRIADVNNEIKSNKGKIELKDKEQTEIESTPPLSYQQRNRVRDIKEEKRLLREEDTKLEGDITKINTELSDNIKAKEDELTKDTDSKKDDNSKSSMLFIIISTFIELTILAGIYFNKYYKFRSYKEFRERVEKDPNYQKWVTYESILNVVYGKDTKINEKLPSNKNIIDMCKLNDVIILSKDIDNFMKLMVNLNIIKSSGSARYIAKQRDISFEILKSHFNIV